LRPNGQGEKKELDKGATAITRNEKSAKVSASAGGAQRTRDLQCTKQVGFPRSGNGWEKEMVFQDGGALRMRKAQQAMGARAGEG